MHRSIESYALLSNERGAALVGLNGGVDWLCWPRFDSDACFAALLGDESNGSWQLAPSGRFTTSRRYRAETLILETEFETESGRALLTDYMTADPVQSLVRIVRGAEGRVAMRSVFAPKFGNGRSAPRFTARDSGLVAAGGASALGLSCSRQGLALPTAAFDIDQGECIAFVLADGDAPIKEPLQFAQTALAACDRKWRAWCSCCTYDGPWREMVLRSLITIKAMIYAPTGGIIAAPTTSLPETPGGARNWDYRYCWLRDSTFAVLALLQCGYADEARRWAEWLVRTMEPERRMAQPVYGVGGEMDLHEIEADWLRGFANSRPVRIGNAAYLQRQLDIYGEVGDTLHQWRATLGAPNDLGWARQMAMLEHLSTLWREPDAGFWEQRSRSEFFTQSRVLAWVAIDRAIKSRNMFNLPAPPYSWETWRSEIHDEICERGFDRELGAFTRSYGSRTLDASTLLMPMVGFLPASDPRMSETINRIASELTQDGFVYRYDQSRENDGIGSAEASFLPCSFWLADCWILQNREDKAAALFEKLIGTANDVGLLAEEYDVSSGRLLGNFPQTLTHLSLIHTALNLEGEGPVHTRSDRAGG